MVERISHDGQACALQDWALLRLRVMISDAPGGVESSKVRSRKEENVDYIPATLHRNLATP